jgi:peptidoglycan hydrolase CwlO-like protein
MNLERDLEYSERSTRGKKILLVISVILTVLLIFSLVGFVKTKNERDSIDQKLITIQKEKEGIQQKLAEMGKENETLNRQVASLTEERDRLAKELDSKKTTPKKEKKQTTPPKTGASGTKK